MRAIRTMKGPMGFSLVELLVVIAIIAVLASLLLPAVNRGKMRAKQIGCVNNLRQVGVAFQNFSHDHNGLFPMAVPLSGGGSEEFTAGSYQVAGPFFFSFHHFQALSNELMTPKVLTCPADVRLPAASFISFNNKNLSYFVGLRAEYSKPYSILAGDRNLTNDFGGIPSLVRPGINRGWRWTEELHQFRGNLLFADVHVEEKTSKSLGASLELASGGDLALPTLPGTANTASTSIPVSIPTARPSLPTGLGTVPGVANTINSAQNQPSARTAPVSLQSSPLALPAASLGSPVSRTEFVTNSSKQTTNPPAPPGPAPKPSSVQEPGFSFFPAWVGNAMRDLLKFAIWILYLLIVLLAAASATIVLRRRSRSAKQLPRL